MLRLLSRVADVAAASWRQHKVTDRCSRLSPATGAAGTNMLLVLILVILSIRTEHAHFPVQRSYKATKLGGSFFCVFILHYSIFIFLRNGCFYSVGFSFLGTSQEIGWEKHLRNDLCCVEWDVKSRLSHLLQPVSYGNFSFLV